MIDSSEKKWDSVHFSYIMETFVRFKCFYSIIFKKDWFVQKSKNDTLIKHKKTKTILQSLPTTYIFEYLRKSYFVRIWMFSKGWFVWKSHKNLVPQNTFLFLSWSTYVYLNIDKGATLWKWRLFNKYTSTCMMTSQLSDIISNLAVNTNTSCKPCLS